jgi:hypothetical protein
VGNGSATTSDAPVAVVVTLQRAAKIGLTNRWNASNTNTLCQATLREGERRSYPL